MNKLKEIIKTNPYKYIDNIDNEDIPHIDNNIDCNRYALKPYFEPKTEIASTAKEIASDLNDTANYAFHCSKVKKIGSSEAIRLLKETKDDVKEGSKRGKPIRNPAALYNWKVNLFLRRKERI